MSDSELQKLKQLANGGSADAMQRYIKSLERLAGIDGSEEPEVYELTPLAKEKWQIHKPGFEVEARIYDSDMLSIYIKGLPDFGFTLHGYSKDHWDWLLNCVSSQIARIALVAYNRGCEDTQKSIKKALGLC